MRSKAEFQLDESGRLLIRPQDRSRTRLLRWTMDRVFLSYSIGDRLLQTAVERLFYDPDRLRRVLRLEQIPLGEAIAKPQFLIECAEGETQ